MGKNAIILLLVIITVIFLAFTSISSQLIYRRITTKEQLKRQLTDEKGKGKGDVVEDITINQPWNCLTPDGWHYIVKMVDEEQELIYIYEAGKFIEKVHHVDSQKDQA